MCILQNALMTHQTAFGRLRISLKMLGEGQVVGKLLAVMNALFAIWSQMPWLLGDIEGSIDMLGLT